MELRLMQQKSDPIHFLISFLATTAGIMVAYISKVAMAFIGHPQLLILMASISWAHGLLAYSLQI